MSLIKGNAKKSNNLLIVLISGLLTLIIGFIFMVIYYIGEQLGFAGVITLAPTDMLSGEGVVVYITVLLGSIFLGSFKVLYLVKRCG